MTENQEQNGIAAVLADMLEIGDREAESLGSAIGVSGNTVLHFKKHQNCVAADKYAALLEHKQKISLIPLIRQSIAVKKAGMEPVQILTDAVEDLDLSGLPAKIAAWLRDMRGKPETSDAEWEAIYWLAKAGAFHKDAGTREINTVLVRISDQTLHLPPR